MMGLRLSALIASCLLLGFASAPAAAGSFRAELRSGVEVVGQITDFRDGYYEFLVGQETKRIKLEDLARLSQVEANANSSEAAAGDGERSLTPEFTLRQKSGQRTTGRIVQFKDGYYDVATGSGTIQVPVSNVAQIALAWQETVRPDISAPFADKLSGTFRIRASADAVEEFVPDLLQFYAQASGQTGRWLPRNADGSRTYSVGLSTETEKLRFEVRADEPKSAVEAVLAGEADLAVVVGELPAEDQPAPVAAVPAVAPNGAVAVASAPAAKAEKPPTTETLRLGPAGAVVIVNEANPIDQLTNEQIAGIFSGTITDWSELGGPHRRIRVHALARPSGVYELAQRTVLKDSSLMLSTYQVDSLGELAEVVSSDPTAIGLTEAASVGAAKPLDIVDQCGTARAPDELSIKLRSYPLTGSFVVHTAAKADSKIQVFRDFLKSELTQNYLKSQGLPNKLVVSAPSPSMRIVDAEGAAVATAATTEGKSDGAIERLSVAFSFNSGSTQPAAGSEEKIEGLKAFLRNRDGQPRRLAVVGFSDSVGNPESNIAISQSRAKNVQALLAKHGVKTEKVLSLGAIFPLACESNPGGAELNRRVEVWLY